MTKVVDITPRGEPAEENGRVVIFFWEGWLGVSPSLINAIEMFAAEGFAVDVLLRSPSARYAEVPTLPPSTRLWRYVPMSERIRRWTRFLMPGPLRRIESNLLTSVDYAQFLAHALARTRRTNYAASIGIDANGIAAAYIISRLKHVRLVYWNLELLFLRDIPRCADQVVKIVERRVSRSAEMVIIQGEQRARLLIKENGLIGSTIVNVPNAPLGSPILTRGRRFHKAFDLPERTRVILHLGMIQEAVLSLELAEAAATWHDEYRLVFHDRAFRSLDEPYIRRVALASGGRARFSLKPVPLDELDSVVSSGDVGIVTYDVRYGENFSAISHAAGKIGYYLRCGLPLLCLRIPGVDSIVERYKCGICVDELGEMEHALNQIFGSYDDFSRAARECYEHEYEFGKYFRPVLDNLRLSVANKSESAGGE